MSVISKTANLMIYDDNYRLNYANLILIGLVFAWAT